MSLRRFVRLAALMVIALAMVLTVSGPAAGGPDCDPEKNPDHPHCQDPSPLPDHPDGATCEDSGDPWIAATNGFSHTMTDKLLCVDWTTTKEASWTIEAELNGAKGFFATIRDSHPGDFCWRADEGMTIVDLPVAAIDVCGPEYTDLADPPEKATPFALTLSYRGKTIADGVTVTVCEGLGPCPETLP